MSRAQRRAVWVQLFLAAMIERQALAVVKTYCRTPRGFHK